MTSPLPTLCCLLLFLPSLAIPLARGQAAAPPETGASTPANPSGEVVTLSEFDVTSTAQKDAYIASEAVSGTRLADKIINQPFDIQVVTRQFLDDFLLYSGDEQMAFTAGYARGQAPAYFNGTSTSERIEGFGTPPVLRDGFSLIGYPPDFNLVQQVEIIKGPESTLYGDGQPGGLINYVMRRPSVTPEYNLNISAGTYDATRFEFDATGPLGTDKLTYLLVASDTNSESPESFVYYKNQIYDFTLNYQPFKNTGLTVNFEKEYTVQERGNVLPKLIVGSTQSGTNPLSRTGGLFVAYDTTQFPYFNEFGPMDHIDRNFTGVNALWEQRFSPDWSLRVAGERFYKNFMEHRWAAASFDAVSQHFDSSQPFAEDQNISLAQFMSDLVGHVNFGPVKNTIQFGFDTNEQSYEDDGFELTTATVSTLVPATQIYQNPFSPDYTPFNYSLIDLGPDQLGPDGRYTTRNLRYILENGYFASERMYLFNDQLILMANGRHNVLYENITDLDLLTHGVIDTNANTYALGAVYKVLPNDNLALFVNKSTGFDSNVVVDQGIGSIEKPEYSWGWEAGAKSALLNERVDFTASWFEITKNNVSIANPSYLNAGAGIPQYIGAGVDFVHGATLDASFHVSDAISVIGDMSYMRSKLVASASTPANVGDVLPFTPTYLFGLAARYQFLNGWLKGFSVGVSTNYDGGMLVSYATTTAARIRLPSVQLWNAFAHYTWKTGHFQQTLGVNFKNIFNRYYLDDLGEPNPQATITGDYSLKF